MNAGPGGLVIIVPVTTTRRGLSSHVELDDLVTGLDEVSYAKCEDVKSGSVQRLLGKLGSTPPDAMATIEQALRYLLRL